MLNLVMMAAIIMGFVSCGGETPTSPGDGGGGDKTYIVSGRIADSSGAGIAAVSVKITGGDVDQTAATGSDGAYSFASIKNGTYTVTPSKSGYTFTPVFRQISISGSNGPVGSFVGDDGGDVVVGSNVSGRVVDDSGNGQLGVSLVLSDIDSSDEWGKTTDAQGAYSFTDINPGSYRLVPSRQGSIFTPEARQLAVTSADLTVDDFTGQEEGTVVIDVPVPPDAPETDAEGSIVIDVPVPPDAPETDEEGAIVIDVPVPPDAPETDEEGTIELDVPIPPDEPETDEDSD